MQRGQGGSFNMLTVVYSKLIIVRLHKRCAVDISLSLGVKSQQTKQFTQHPKRITRRQPRGFF